MSRPTDLVQGTVDLLILKTVALEPMHGWAISQRVKQVSSNVLKINDNALYPALHRLEEQGWLKSEWGESENNRKAKYYSLTRSGRKRLEVEAAQWRRLSAAIETVVRMA
jgi:PadR family transcriptional regulator PadR